MAFGLDRENGPFSGVVVEHLQFTLVDPSLELTLAWREHFSDCPNVTVFHGRFEDVSAFDCMVSPANSFGLMDGGVDAAITAFFGVQLMERVQRQILDQYLGEQPVGSCMLVESGDTLHPWLAHAPTMRVPMDIRGTDNVYYAMLAVIREVVRGNRSGAQIQRVLCPGLGTGYGRMPGEEAARQMRAAYETLIRAPSALTWSVAASKQRLVDVVPTQLMVGGLDLHLRSWRPWDEAAFELARAIGLARGASFTRYRAVLWDDANPVRAELMATLNRLVGLGILKSRETSEMEYCWVAEGDR